MKKLNTTTIGLILIGLVIVGGLIASNIINSSSSDEAQSSKNETYKSYRDFRGNQGDKSIMGANGFEIEASRVNDGKAHFFNVMMKNDKPVYFFIVKSPDGKLRAAANGCQVCGKALQGFRQEGENMVCNTCGNKFHLDKLSTQKGGCNPAPISYDLKVIDGKIKISETELMNVQYYFQ
jgi:hypothetical protein